MFDDWPMPLILDCPVFAMLHAHGCWPPRQYRPQHVDEVTFERCYPWCLEVPEIVERHHAANAINGAHLLRTVTHCTASICFEDPDSQELMLEDQRVAVQVARRAASQSAGPVAVVGVIGPISPESLGTIDETPEGPLDETTPLPDEQAIERCYQISRSMAGELVREGVDFLYFDDIYSVRAMQIVSAVAQDTRASHSRKIPMIACVRTFSGRLLTAAPLAKMAEMLHQDDSTVLGISSHNDWSIACETLQQLSGPWRGKKLLSMFPGDPDFFPPLSRNSPEELAEAYRSVVEYNLADVVGGGRGTTLEDTLALSRMFHT